MNLSAILPVNLPRWSTKGPPRGPRRTLIGGNCAELNTDSLAFYTRCEREFGGLVACRMFHKPWYIVTEPAFIDEILRKQHKSFSKGFGLQKSRVLFGDGVLTAEGEIWRSHRQSLAGLFRGERLPGYAAIVAARAGDALDSWRDGETRDVYADMLDLCLETLQLTMFGEVIPGLGEKVARIVAELQGLFSHFLRWSGVIGRQQLRAAISDFDETVSDIVSRSRARGDQGNDFVSTLLRAQRKDPEAMTDRHIRDEIVTMLLAGHETTATTIAWATYLLARHPETATALQTELDANLSNGSFADAAFADLPVLDQVLSETLRLYPSTHRLSRESTERVALGDHEFPAGIEFCIPLWAVHRSPRLFERPDEFVPERWTPTFRENLAPGAYLPFGAGPRGCLGKSLAILETKIILAMIVSRVDVRQPVPQVRAPRVGFTLTPAGGTMPLVVKRRTQSTSRASRPVLKAKPSGCPYHHA